MITDVIPSLSNPNNLAPTVTWTFSLENASSSIHKHFFQSTSVRKKSIFTSLIILRDASFKTTLGTCNYKNCNISLICSCNYVLDKSRLSGASITVKSYLGNSKFHKTMSIVISRSHSAFILSRTNAYLNKFSLSSCAFTYLIIQRAGVIISSVVEIIYLHPDQLYCNIFHWFNWHSFAFS